MTSIHNGHPIYWDFTASVWKYVSDDTPIAYIRPCPKCGGSEEEYESCFGKLPGVTNACCGHGVSEGYIQFENGTTVRFNLVSVEKAINKS